MMKSIHDFNNSRLVTTSFTLFDPSTLFMFCRSCFVGRVYQTMSEPEGVFIISCFMSYVWQPIRSGIGSGH